MEFGVHLPVLGFGELPVAPNRCMDYVEHVESLGFTTLAAHDHLVNVHPWLDGPIALAAAVARTQKLRLVTAVWLPVLRGPVVLARTYIALDLLSGGRVVAGIGAGSSAGDYAAVGVPFEERWARFDESVHALRALWGSGEPFRGRFYSTAGVTLDPGPTRPDSLPVWIGAWGSAAGLRRVARHADGWIASAYNTTPATFAEHWTQLQAQLAMLGKPVDMPNAIATMATCLTDTEVEAEALLTDVLGPLLHRDPTELAKRILVGTPDQCITRLREYRAAGAQQVYLMPIRDAFRQLERFCTEVQPFVNQ